LEDFLDKSEVLNWRFENVDILGQSKDKFQENSANRLKKISGNENNSPETLPQSVYCRCKAPQEQQFTTRTIVHHKTKSSPQKHQFSTRKTVHRSFLRW
jgi:hypothetical protein